MFILFVIRLNSNIETLIILTHEKKEINNKLFVGVESEIKFVPKDFLFYFC